MTPDVRLTAWVGYVDTAGNSTMNYLVWSYQYREMRRPKVEAIRRTYGDKRDP